MYGNTYEKRQQRIANIKSVYWDCFKKGFWYQIFCVVTNLLAVAILIPLHALKPESNFYYCLILFIIFLFILLPFYGYAIKVFMRLMQPKTIDAAEEKNNDGL